MRSYHTPGVRNYWVSTHINMVELTVIVHPSPQVLNTGVERQGALLTDLVPAWAAGTTREHVRRGQQNSPKWQGQCNSTHSVNYRVAQPHMRTDAANSIHVYRVQSNDFAPVPVKRAAPHVLFLLEMSPHLSFAEAEGFSGTVEVSRRGEVWRPWFNPRALWEAGRQLRFEPTTRTNVGVWVDNCMMPTRNRIIDQLMNSGLPVASYGRCKGNMGTRFIGERLQSGSPVAIAECRRHRVMLAVENKRCPGWISSDLKHALVECGAIPIIHTVSGLPDYWGDVGGFPAINASQPGWLRKVMKVLHNDTFYHHVLTLGKKQAARRPPNARALELESRWHW